MVCLPLFECGTAELGHSPVEGVDISSHQVSVLGGTLDLNYVASYMEEKSYSVGGTSQYVDYVGVNVPIGGEGLQ